MNEGEQLELLEVFKEYYKELPFEKHKKKDVRYFFENIAFTYGDAITLFCMIRHVRPKRIIEVGSGYSSCVILDTNELFFDNSISCAFIEPYPERFYSLLLDSDKSRIEIIPKKLQDVDLSKFSDLSQGDFLFIDSTHVSKINSDVNHVFFNVLPSLATGVYIHFHDIGYPFEYPKQWVYEGKGWNEAYLARAFLQYNTQFKIQFHSSFLHAFHKDKLLGAMPLYSPNAGCSIWIKKL